MKKGFLFIYLFCTILSNGQKLFITSGYYHTLVTIDSYRNKAHYNYLPINLGVEVDQVRVNLNTNFIYGNIHYYYGNSYLADNWQSGNGSSYYLYEGYHINALIRQINLYNSISVEPYIKTGNFFWVIPQIDIGFYSRLNSKVVYDSSYFYSHSHQYIAQTDQHTYTSTEENIEYNKYYWENRISYSMGFGIQFQFNLNESNSIILGGLRRAYSKNLLGNSNSKLQYNVDWSFGLTYQFLIKNFSKENSK